MLWVLSPLAICRGSLAVQAMVSLPAWPLGMVKFTSTWLVVAWPGARAPIAVEVPSSTLPGFRKQLTVSPAEEVEVPVLVTVNAAWPEPPERMVGDVLSFTDRLDTTKFTPPTLKACVKELLMQLCSTIVQVGSTVAAIEIVLPGARFDGTVSVPATVPFPPGDSDPEKVEVELARVLPPPSCSVNSTLVLPVNVATPLLVTVAVKVTLPVGTGCVEVDATVAPRGTPRTEAALNRLPLPT